MFNSTHPEEVKTNENVTKRKKYYFKTNAVESESISCMKYFFY